MCWWTNRGKRASDQRTQVGELLQRSRQAWGRQVRHIWDREFASGPWLCLMLDSQIRFVLRWKKRQKLLDSWGELRKAWEITRGKRSWEYRHLRDSHTGERHKVGVVAVCVTHPAHPQPLWLVVARPGRHYELWYLLTSDPIRTAEDAWSVVMAYARRRQIEPMFRDTKQLLDVAGCHSPRVEAQQTHIALVLVAWVVLQRLCQAPSQTTGEVREQLIATVWGHTTRFSAPVSDSVGDVSATAGI